jgi:hypothetical protein
MWVRAYTLAGTRTKNPIGYVDIEKLTRLDIISTGSGGITPGFPYDNKFAIMADGSGIVRGTYLAFFNTREEAEDALEAFVNEAGYAVIISTVEEKE